jgi:hypothetical protein
VLLGKVFAQLSPHARVATAVLPFFFAMVARLLWGKSRIMGWLMTLSTIWLVINVLMAPYSAPMRQEIQNLVVRLR